MRRTVNVFAICSLQEVKPLQRLFGGRVLPCGFCMPGGLEALYTGEAVGRDDFGRDLVPHVEIWKQGGLMGAAC